MRSATIGSTRHRVTHKPSTLLRNRKNYIFKLRTIQYAQVHTTTTTTIYTCQHSSIWYACAILPARRLANKKSINRVEHRRSTFYYKIMNTRVRVCTYVRAFVFFRYQFFCCVCCVGSTDTTFACAHGGSAHGVHGAQCSAVSTPWRACALARDTHNRQSYVCVCARARIDYKRVDRPTETCISNLSMHTRGGCLATLNRVLTVWNIYNIKCTR